MFRQSEAISAEMVGKQAVRLGPGLPTPGKGLMDALSSEDLRPESEPLSGRVQILLS